MKEKKGEQKKVTVEELDEEVQRYRDAVKADTLCDRCLYANPPKSRYCADCGRALG